MADFTIGQFQVLGTLGSGAHSTILHIRRSADGKQYALKVVPIEDKDDHKYFEQAQHEFRVGQLLAHPNLSKVFAFETQKDWLFRVKKVHLLIEYVNGKTLDKIARLSIPRLVQIFAKVAAGLGHMHRRNVYHADLKPNNIMLSKAGEVKVIDYGLAWVKGEAKGRVQGTPEYMAPEQAKSGMVNAKTDIYNLGATMYRLVTFQKPPSATAGDVGMDGKMFQKLLKPVSELNPQTPEKLCELIHECMSYKPGQRPDDMTAVVAVLEPMIEVLVRSPEDGLEGMEW